MLANLREVSASHPGHQAAADTSEVSEQVLRLPDVCLDSRSQASSSYLHTTVIQSCADNLTCREISEAEAGCLVRSLLETSYLEET